MAFTDSLKQIGQGLKGMGEDLKKKAYETAASVKKSADEGTLLSDATRVVANAAGNVAKRAETLDAKVKARGGYLTVVANAAGGALDAIDDRINNLCDTLEDRLTSDGKFDSDKLKIFLADGAKATREYGAKAVETLTELAQKGAKITADDFRSYFPTENDLRTKYAGIGTVYHGALLTEHLDSCLTFYRKAQKAIPKEVSYKSEVLGFIKASASRNPKELRDSYDQLGTSELTAERKEALLKTVNDYLG
jgi:hypothetical protein